MKLCKASISFSALSKNVVIALEEIPAASGVLVGKCSFIGAYLVILF